MSPWLQMLDQIMYTDQPFKVEIGNMSVSRKPPSKGKSVTQTVGREEEGGKLSDKDWESYNQYPEPMPAPSADMILRRPSGNIAPDALSRFQDTEKMHPSLPINIQRYNPLPDDLEWAERYKSTPTPMPRRIMPTRSQKFSPYDYIDRLPDKKGGNAFPLGSPDVIEIPGYLPRPRGR